MIVERGSNGIMKKKTSGPRGPEFLRAWKSHRFATPESRLGLCVIYHMGIHYGGDYDPVKYRPETIYWEGVVVPEFKLIIPELADGVMNRAGTRKLPIDADALSGRWVNFFHVYKINGASIWSLKDTEYPATHPELAQYLPEAYRRVQEFYK